MAERATITLGPGRYYAGLTRPWYVTQNSVRSYAEGLGFVRVEFHRRLTPPPVNPRIDPYYLDTWDEWVSADYELPTRVPTVFDRLWAWMVRTPPPKPKPSAAPPKPGTTPPKPGTTPPTVPGASLPSSRAAPPSPEPASSPLWVALPALGLLGWALLRRVRL